MLGGNQAVLMGLQRDIVSPPIVAEWLFSGGDFLLDTSGNSNTLTNTGTTATTDQQSTADEARLFDNASDKLVASDSASLSVTGSITIISWVKSVNGSSIGGRIVDKRIDSVSGYQLAFGGDGTPRIFVANATGVSVTAGTVAKNDGLWHMFAGRYTDGGSADMFVDGIEDSNVLNNFATGLADNGAAVQIGKEIVTPFRSFDGSIGDTTIYNGALSDSEILTIYNDTKS